MFFFETRCILATIYNQSQLAERKHVARYWSINTAVTAVPLIAHPSPIEVAAATATDVPLIAHPLNTETIH